LCLISSDALAIAAALLAASVLRNLLLGDTVNHLAVIVPALATALCSFLAAGLYPGVCVNPVEELRRCSLSITLSFLCLLSVTFLRHDLTPSRVIFVFAYLLTLCLVPLLRTGTRSLFAGKPWWGSQVAIIGFGTTGKLVYESLINNPRIGLKPVAVLDDNPATYSNLAGDLTRGPLSRCSEIIRSQHISHGIVCMPNLSRPDLLSLLERYSPCFGHLLIIPNLMGISSLGICAREMGGIVGVEVTQQLLRPSSRLAKRILDLVLTLLISPLVVFLIAVSALLIKLESPGLVFFANERIGRGGRKFKAWKLRSMVPDSDNVLAAYLAAHPAEAEYWHKTQKLKCDPRITRIGRIIRKTSIDELPQFWNVLTGQMSVVGPRPVLAHQTALYGASFNLYKKVRPGITGLWQVSGRNELPFSERVKLDKYVIQNWSVWLDIYILARTVNVLLTAKGAY
jgi:Undecaprenyl-phosphate galactose phosphotransferase WbaP